VQTTFDTPESNKSLETNCRWREFKVVFATANFGSANVLPTRDDWVKFEISLTVSAFIFTKRPEFDSKVRSWVPSGVEIGTMTLKVVKAEAEMVTLTVPIKTRFTTSRDVPTKFKIKPGDVV
jgi:hypothetical protein